MVTIYGIEMKSRFQCWEEVIKIEKSINEALQELQEEINEKQNQMNLIKNIDWNKSVNDETWHEICETPLRTSDLLGVIVKNIFPDAENVNVHCNYVYFELDDFECGLPTSRCKGVYIKTDWYKKDNGKPSSPYFAHHSVMKKYFDAKDSGEHWDVLFKYRLPYFSSYKKWIRFILWFGYYKWKSDNREKWEEIFKDDESSFAERVNRYYEERKTIHDKSENMVKVLIPKLKKFSDKIYRFDNSWYDIEKIIELENL